MLKLILLAVVNFNLHTFTDRGYAQSFTENLKEHVSERDKSKVQERAVEYVPEARLWNRQNVQFLPAKGETLYRPQMGPRAVSP